MPNITGEIHDTHAHSSSSCMKGEHKAQAVHDECTITWIFFISIAVILVKFTGI